MEEDATGALRRRALWRRRMPQRVRERQLLDAREVCLKQVVGVLHNVIVAVAGNDGQRRRQQQPACGQRDRAGGVWKTLGWARN